MLIRSPTNLHYPITVTELLKNQNDEVARFAPLFSYFYKSTVTEGNKYGEEYQVEKEFPARFESETEGTLLRWKIKAGTVVNRAGIELVEINEPCRHETQFSGMCAECGKQMDEVNYATSVKDSDRAPINMTHGYTTLTISHDEASRIEEDAKKRLLNSRKLILVVDLDQTIIQATVDPTVAEWQKDIENPNHQAVKDVRAFQLIDDGPGGRGCWYYIKLRPGLENFLKEVSKTYELHIYTMGTRAYAENIVKIIDPNRKFFGDRILSRDESGSLTVKTLRRLFPVDTKMVVIIDDRGDVWGWHSNLMKVKAFEFFVGIGDINSSFLPKRPQDSAKPKVAVLEATVEEKSEDAKPDPSSEVKDTAVNGAPPVENDAKKGDLTALEQQIMAMGGANSPELLQQQSTKQDETIAAQVSERPLMQKQMLLDQADNERADKENQDSAVEPPEIDQHRHRPILRDDDTELVQLEAGLGKIHQAFYEEYEKMISGSFGRIAELRGAKGPKKQIADQLGAVPDVQDIMPDMKREVFNGCYIVFSGVIPQNVPIQSADQFMIAQTYGARITQNITKKTTHVIAPRDRRTVKVKRAARYPQIKIVCVDWFYQCVAKIERLDERPFIIHVEREDHNSQNGVGEFSPLEELDEGSFLSGDDDALVTGDETEDIPSTGETDEETEPRSPVITEDTWKSINSEMDDFMNEIDSDTEEVNDNDDDTDGGSESEQESAAAGGDVESEESDGDSSAKPKKRKRQPSSTSTSEAEDSDASAASVGDSRLQKRKRRAMQRVSSLTNVSVAEKSSGLPSPDTTIPEDAKAAAKEVDVNGEDDEETRAFEAEFMAEFDDMDSDS